MSIVRIMTEELIQLLKNGDDEALDKICLKSNWKNGLDFMKIYLISRMDFPMVVINLWMPK